MPYENPPEWEIYKKEMDIHRRGDALWQPTPSPDIGDVGFIRDGRFNLLFSAGSPLGGRQLGVDVPNEFEQLEVEPPVPIERPAGCFHSPTIRKRGECRGGNAYPGFTPLPPAERSTTFSFDLNGDRGAALVTTGEMHWKDTPGPSKPRFKAYIKRHYNSWVRFARGKPDADGVWPILVTGFDVTEDFAMVAYSYEDAPLKPKPYKAPMAPFLGEWKWHGKHPPKSNYGPQDASDPPECIQRVFIRYYTMRPRRVPFFRKKIPKKIRAGAGPHDLGSGDNQGETFPELTVQSDAELTASDDEDLGRQLGPITPADEYDSWDAIADYVFKNSDAESVLMHHQDLIEIRAAGDSGDISSLLAMKRPHVVMDESGVGIIVCRENRPLKNDDNSSQRVKPALDVVSGGDNYLGCAEGFKGQGIDPSPSITGLKQSHITGPPSPTSTPDKSLAVAPFRVHPHKRTLPDAPVLPVNSDIKYPVSEILQRFKKLNLTDASYQPLLFQPLIHQDLKSRIRCVQGPSLRSFVEFLDRALNHIPENEDLPR